MVSFANPVRDRLAAGDLALGVGMRQSRTVDIAPIMKACDFDWLFLDLEHGSMDLDMAAQISVAALGAGISPLIRVPNGDYSMATRALDNGAMGVVMPHVDSAEEAAEVARQLRYPPRGIRSVFGAIPQFHGVGGTAGERIAAMNDAILTTVMVESPEAIAAVDEIAAVDGVDVVMIGTNDLCTEIGCPGVYDDPRIVEAYQALTAACAKHGKWAGMGGVYDDALIAKYVAMGVRFILSGNDLTFMMSGARARSGALRNIKL